MANRGRIRAAEGIGGRVKFLPLAWAGMPKTSFRKNSDSLLQFTRRHEHDIVDVIQEKSTFSRFSACVFGTFPIEADLKYFAKAFTDAFEPKKVTLNGSSLAALYRSGFTSALRIGHSNIEVD